MATFPRTINLAYSAPNSFPGILITWLGTMPADMIGRIGDDVPIRCTVLGTTLLIDVGGPIQANFIDAYHEGRITIRIYDGTNYNDYTNFILEDVPDVIDPYRVTMPNASLLAATQGIQLYFSYVDKEFEIPIDESMVFQDSISAVIGGEHSESITESIGFADSIAKDASISINERIVYQDNIDLASTVQKNIHENIIFNEDIVKDVSTSINERIAYQESIAKDINIRINENRFDINDIIEASILYFIGINERIRVRERRLNRLINTNFNRPFTESIPFTDAYESEAAYIRNFADSLLILEDLVVESIFSISDIESFRIQDSVETPRMLNLQFNENINTGDAFLREVEYLRNQVQGFSILDSLVSETELDREIIERIILGDSTNNLLQINRNINESISFRDSILQAQAKEYARRFTDSFRLDDQIDNTIYFGNIWPLLLPKYFDAEATTITPVNNTIAFATTHGSGKRRPRYTNSRKIYNVTILCTEEQWDILKEWSANLIIPDITFLTNPLGLDETFLVKMLDAPQRAQRGVNVEATLRFVQ